MAGPRPTELAQLELCESALPFVRLLQSLGYEIGSVRGELLGHDAGRRYVVVSFLNDRDRQRAAFRIGTAAGEQGLDLATIGRTWDFEAGGRYFLYWPQVWGEPV
jgi:hypothetical protein